MSRDPSRMLRAALFANAAFSFTCGLVLVLSPATVSGWLGHGADALLRVLGFGLALFAAELVYQATRPRLATWRALAACMADFAWVAASIALCLLAAAALSGTGVLTVLVIAAAVLGFGCWQLAGILRVHRGDAPGVYRHCLRVETDASAERMWLAVSDLGGIERYFPALRASSLRDGVRPGLGAVRECEDAKGRRWAEECVGWSEGDDRFELRFLSEEPGFPFPASEMRGGWQVSGANGESSVIEVWWELVPKPLWLAALLLPLLAFQADRDFPKIIARMASGAGEPRAAEGAARPSRLLPEFC